MRLRTARRALCYGGFSDGAISDAPDGVKNGHPDIGLSKQKKQDRRKQPWEAAGRTCRKPWEAGKQIKSKFICKLTPVHVRLRLYDCMIVASRRIVGVRISWSGQWDHRPFPPAPRKCPSARIATSKPLARLANNAMNRFVQTARHFTAN